MAVRPQDLPSDDLKRPPVGFCPLPHPATASLSHRPRTSEGAEWNGFFLGGAADGHVTGGMSVEGALEHGAGDIGVIAITAEVTEPEVTQARRDDLADELSGLLITEVAMTAGDPLFGSPWSFCIGSQQLRAIIRFDEQPIQARRWSHAPDH